MANTFKRTERKYLLTPEQCTGMLSVLRENMDPDDFDVGGNGYMVYNIYYDNENNSIIRNSVSKPPYKEKLRVRAYELPEQDSKVYVEIKKKIKGVVSKRRVGMKLSQVEPFLLEGIRPKGKSPVSEHIMDEILYFQSIYHAKPMLYLSYHRYAFKGKTDKSFRVTLDREITTRREDLKLENGSYGELLVGEQGIMEIKFTGSMPLWISRTLYEMGILKTSFSKYGTEYSNYRKSLLEQK